MVKKAKTVAEKKHLERVKNLPCVACETIGVYDNDFCDAHHIHGYHGLFGKAPHTETLPLCKAHHQTGGYGVAFHNTPKDLWESTFGNQLDLLDKVNEQLGL